MPSSFTVSGPPGADGATGATGPGFLTDTQANRPAAAAAGSGAVFIPADGYYPAISNGTTWDVYAVPGFKCSNPPAMGEFTAYNVGAITTLAADGDGLLLTQTGNNSTSDCFSAYLMSLPGATFTLSVGIDIQYLYQPTNSWGGNALIGICLMDGTNPASAKGYNFRIQATNSSPYNTTGATIWAFGKTNLTGSGGTYVSAPLGFPVHSHSQFFMRLRQDGTYIYAEVSADSRNWGLLYRVAKADYATVAYGGLFCGQQTAAVPSANTASQAKYFHWSLA